VPAEESLTVPRGATHAFRNASETPVRFLNTHRPALTFQKFLETVDRLIQAGKVKGPRDLRSGIYLSLAAVEQGTSGTGEAAADVASRARLHRSALGLQTGMTWPVAGRQVNADMPRRGNDRLAASARPSQSQMRRWEPSSKLVRAPVS
jgi:hypothetical protein